MYGALYLIIPEFGGWGRRITRSLRPAWTVWYKNTLFYTLLKKIKVKVLYTYAAHGHKCKRLHQTIICSTFTSWASSPALSTFLMHSCLSHAHQNDSESDSISGLPVLQVFHILPADHMVRRITAANPLVIAMQLLIIESDLREKEFCFSSGFTMLSSNWTPSKVVGTCSMACYSWWIRKQRARPELGSSL